MRRLPRHERANWCRNFIPNSAGSRLWSAIDPDLYREPEGSEAGICNQSIEGADDMRGSHRKESLAKASPGTRAQVKSARASGQLKFNPTPRATFDVKKEASPERPTNRNAARRLKQLAAQIRTCTRCPLCQSRTVAVPGDGDSRPEFMIIGEAPGKDEDKTG